MMSSRSSMFDAMCEKSLIANNNYMKLNYDNNYVKLLGDKLLQNITCTGPSPSEHSKVYMH